MADKWQQIAQSEQFQALDVDQRQAVRGRFFEREIKPKAPEGRAADVQSAFFTRTEQDVFGQRDAQQQDDQSESGVGLMDYARELGAGVLEGTGSVMQGAGDLVEQGGEWVERGLRGLGLGDAVDAGDRALEGMAPSDAARGAGQWYGEGADELRAGQSEAARQARQQSTPTGDITQPSTWSMGEDPSAAGYGLQVANLIGQFAPQAAALIAPGGQARMAGMAGIGGMQAGGAAGEDAERYVMEMDDEALAENSGLYRDLREQGVDAEDARRQTAAAARGAAFSGAAPVGAAGGALTGYILGPFQRAIGGGVGRRLGYGLAVDAPLEGGQEVTETVAGRMSQNQAIGGQRDVTADTFGDAALGAIAGGGHAALGAAMGERLPSRRQQTQNDVVRNRTPEDRAAAEEQYYRDRDNEARQWFERRRNEQAGQQAARDQFGESGAAVWRNADHDLPVTVQRIEPEPDAEGRQYAMVEREGQQSYVPVDELEATEADNQAPVRPDPRQSELGVDNDIRVAEQVGAEDDAARLRNARSLFVRAMEHDASGDNATGSRLRERGLTIYRDIYGDPDSPMPERPASFPVPYEFVGDVEPRSQLPESTDAAQQGETYPGQQADPELDRPAQRLRQGDQRTGESIQYGSGPVAGNANTGMDQAFEGARFTDTDAHSGRDADRDWNERLARGASERARTLGGTETTYLPDNTPVRTRFRVIEADNMRASNTPDGRVNPDYPRELQPRDRTSANSQVQVRNMAAELNPERLGGGRDAGSGAPIIGSDGVVESGNGRTMAIQQAYRNGSERADSYRRFVRQQAESQGIDPEVIDGMRQPVLVRERITNVDRADFARRANESQVSGMTAFEQAQSDAAALTAEDMQSWAPDQSGDPLAATNRDFQRRFTRNLGANEAARFTSRDGQATSELGARMQRAVFARAYADPDMVEMATDQSGEMRNLLGAMQSAAADIAVARDSGSESAVEGISAINDAVRLIRRSRQDGTAVSEMVNQGDAFSGNTDPLVADLAVALDGSMRSQRALNTAMGYIGRALRDRAQGEQNGALFADDTTNGDVFNAGFQQAAAEPGSAQADVSTRDRAGEQGAAAGRADPTAVEESSRNSFSREGSNDRDTGTLPDESSRGVEQARRDRSTGDLFSRDGDLFATGALPNNADPSTAEVAKEQLSDNFRVQYRLRDVTDIPVGIDRIQGPEDVAHLIAPLRKNAQEQLWAVVTDEDGGNINVLQHTVGANNASNVYIAELIAGASTVSGGRRIWLSHNHPSGEPEPSRADYAITERIRQSLDASGLEFQGHIITGAGGTDFTLFSELGDARPIKATVANRRYRQGIKRQMLASRRRPDRTITSPLAAMQIAEEMTTGHGIMLLDTQNAVIGVLSMTDPEMSSLREGGRVARIARAIGESNTSGFIILSENESSANNVANYLHTLDGGQQQLRILDALVGPAGDRASMSAQRREPGDGGTFYSMGYRPPENAPTAEQVREAMGGVESALGDVNVVDSAADLPSIMQLEMRLQGVNPSGVRGIYRDGEVYVIAGNTDSVDQAMRTAIHEAVGHKGIRGVLGDELDTVMHQLYNTLPHSRQGRRALNEVLDAYPFLDRGNPDHQRMIAEEMVAHLLEKGHRPRAWQRAVAKIRDLLRRMFPGMSWTYTDVLAMGEQSREYLQRQQDGERTGMRFSMGPSQGELTADQFNDLSAEQRDFMSKFGSRTPTRRAMEWWKDTTQRAGLRIRQGLVDQYAALKELDEARFGRDGALQENITSSSWVLARMSNAANGALHTMLHNGRIRLDPEQKVVDLQEGDAKGLGAVLGQLGKPAEIERFMMWVAANRSSRLMDEGREFLFTEGEIEAGMRLDKGQLDDGGDRAARYARVFDEFQQYRDDVLAIAEQTGIIRPDQRAMWRDEFYVPFYRLKDDKEVNVNLGTSGLSRQQAYKQLKGGTENINDLLQNTLMNFHHLLEASLKNQAAGQAIENAEAMGMARQVPESNRDTSKSTFVLRKGARTFYEIDDPMVFESISSLSQAGMNNTMMKVMRGFKRVFTNLTTTTPQFMAANLIRDSLQAVATNEVSKNAFKNVYQGAGTFRDQRKRARMLASGGSFHFGHLYGNNPDELRAQLTRNLRDAKIVGVPGSGVTGMATPAQALRAGWAQWGNVNNFFENVNRAAIYEQNQDQGALKAAFEARDLIDFSARGTWPAVRILTDIVPFLNARIQGLDKIYRSGVRPGVNVLGAAFGKGQAGVTDKQAAARFWSVAGTLSLATMALYLHNRDDEDYRELEDWQKDTYWFFKVGGQAFFIPKPFEVGAIATMVERITEQFADDEATGELFIERMRHMMTGTFAFSPVPQMMQPALDVYANRDSFTNRPIESMGDERLSPELRQRQSTSLFARGASAALNNTIGAIGDPELNPAALSPLQVDYLVQGYLGQVGAWAAGSLDVAWKAFDGKDEPANRWYEYQPVRRFYRNLGDEPRYTRYGTIFYDGLREAQRAYADVKELGELGRLEEAKAMAQSKADILRLRKPLARAQRRLNEVRTQMDQIRRSDMDGDLKRQRLDRMLAIQNRIQKVLAQEVIDMRTAQ